jgi:hypothetical protein
MLNFFFYAGQFCLPKSRSIPDPGSASKNLSILTPKNGFYALRNMILVYHPGSRSQIRILIFYLSCIQGSKSNRIPYPGSGSATLFSRFGG